MELTGTPLTDQVRRALIAYIDERNLAAGDALPSTAELSERFGVSRPVVREALSALAALGLIELSNGRHAVVKELDEQLITLYLSRALRSTPRRLTALMELRVPLEIQAAALAAERATDAEREALSVLVHGMTGQIGKADAYVRLDLQLHRQIAVLGGNPALLGITDAVRGQVFDAMTRLRALREERGLVGAEHREHDAVVAAIVAGDAEAAGEAMRAHLRTTGQLVAVLDDATATSPTQPV
ncbi:hypothetical protein BKD30_04290 [Tersicoccus phoenicis]|uniref:HTH gntR-type domain-containing protein n=1 Tax=Tersicoccus phoenicis TaxID=554083 RepID=A0A1R1LHH8_9MICC|nr:FCD domain-containing protein [Tersicoccus phoenicis]OMH26970.1 hypothetical protein BKD30_04290 [Tersicoccus phoenicis]